MRTPHLGRTARLAAAASMTVAVAGFAFAPAATATTSTTPSPTPSATSSPTPSASPSPDDKPTEPSPGAFDVSVTMKAEDKYEPGKVGAVKIRVRSDKPVSGYHLEVKWPRELPMFEVPQHDGWDCDFGSPKLACDWTGAPTTRPGEVWVAFSFPKRAGFSATVSAHVSKVGDDTPANNTVRRNLVVAAAPAKTYGRITGRIWNDANGNGHQDAGEKGVAGATVGAVIVAEKGGLVASTTTGPDGYYSFGRLRPTTGSLNSYHLLIATPDKSWRLTRADVGSDAKDSDLYVPGNDSPIGEKKALEILGRKAGQANVGSRAEIGVPVNKAVVLDAGLVKDSSGGGDDDGSLPKTGASTGWILGAGGLLVVSGLGLTLLARRRRVVI